MRQEGSSCDAGSLRSSELKCHTHTHTSYHVCLSIAVAHAWPTKFYLVYWVCLEFEDAIWLEANEFRWTCQSVQILHRLGPVASTRTFSVYLFFPSLPSDKYWQLVAETSSPWRDCGCTLRASECVIGSCRGACHCSSLKALCSSPLACPEKSGLCQLAAGLFAAGTFLPGWPGPLRYVPFQKSELGLTVKPSAAPFDMQCQRSLQVLKQGI